MKVAQVFTIAVVASHCGRSAPSTPGAPASAAVAVSSISSAGDGGEAMDAREAEAWAHAKDGDDEDRVRLADLLGCEGLRERAADPALRPTAIRAMAYCPDFSALPWLVGVAKSATDEEAAAALDAVIEQAARPRHATDPEDAEELGAGCADLLALARAVDRPRARRTKAVSALRMLSERGCVKRADIPTDLDAK